MKPVNKSIIHEMNYNCALSTVLPMDEPISQANLSKGNFNNNVNDQQPPYRSGMQLWLPHVRHC